MSGNNEPLRSYEIWHEFTTGQCGLDLSRSFCFERIEELRDDSASTTKSFVACYGPSYREMVVSWFERAAVAAS